MTDDAGDRTDATASSRRTFLAGAGAVGATALGASAVFAGATDATGSTTFTVRVENVSSNEEFPLLLSPGAYAVHAEGEPIFTAGEPERRNGLEEVIEDGMPGRLAESLAARDDVVTAGAFTTPEGDDSPGPLPPGNAYEFQVEGKPNTYLSFATMFVQSNDLFYAPDPGGLPLFEHDGDPVTGDVTDWVEFWDAGTEVNERPGHGENQAPRQPEAGVGLVERGTVVPVSEVNGYDYPAVHEVVEVSLSAGSDDGREAK